MKRLHELTTNTFESQPVSKKGRSNCKKLWKNARQINQTPSTILCESFVVNEHLKCLRLQYGRNTRNTTKGFSVSLEEKKSKSQFLLTFGLKEIKINHYEISSGQRKLSSSKPKVSHWYWFVFFSMLLLHCTPAVEYLPCSLVCDSFTLI